MGESVRERLKAPGYPCGPYIHMAVRHGYLAGESFPEAATATPSWPFGERLVDLRARPHR